MENHTNDIFDRLKDELPTATLSDADRITIPQSLRDGIERDEYVEISMRPLGEPEMIERKFVAKLISDWRVTIPEYYRQYFDLTTGDAVAVISATAYPKEPVVDTDMEMGGNGYLRVPDTLIDAAGLRPEDRVSITIEHDGETATFTDRLPRNTDRKYRAHVTLPDDKMNVEKGDGIEIINIEHDPLYSFHSVLKNDNVIDIHERKRDEFGLSIGDPVESKWVEDNVVEVYDPDDRSEPILWYDEERDSCNILPLKTFMRHEPPATTRDRVKPRERTRPGDHAALSAKNRITIPKPLRKDVERVEYVENGWFYDDGKMHRETNRVDLERGDYVEITARPPDALGVKPVTFLAEVKANNRITVPKYVRDRLELTEGIDIFEVSALADPATAVIEKWSPKKAKRRAEAYFDRSTWLRNSG